MEPSHPDPLLNRPVKDFRNTRGRRLKLTVVQGIRARHRCVGACVASREATAAPDSCKIAFLELFPFTGSIAAAKQAK